jgi:hypothetical protein
MKTKKESANPVVRNKYTAQFCNGQLKPDTFLSSLLIEFPLKFHRGLIA